MYLTVPTAVSTASVFSIGLECATETCSHSHSYSGSRSAALPKYFITSPWSRCTFGPLRPLSLFACDTLLLPVLSLAWNIVSIMSRPMAVCPYRRNKYYTRVNWSAWSVNAKKYIVKSTLNYKNLMSALSLQKSWNVFTSIDEYV